MQRPPHCLSRLHQLGTSGTGHGSVRQLAVDLSVNPNTVSRAYTELELTGLVETQMGSGTFVGSRTVELTDVEKRRVLDQLCQEVLSRASTHGFTLSDVLENLEQRRER